MDLIDICGWVGAICLTGCGVPQLIHTWKTRDVQGLSLGMLLSWFVGVICTAVFIYFRSFQLPLFFNYFFNTFVVGTILYFYLKHRHDYEPKPVSVYCGTIDHKGIKAKVTYNPVDDFFMVDAYNIVDIVSEGGSDYEDALLEFEQTADQYLNWLQQDGVDLISRMKHDHKA